MTKTEDESRPFLHEKPSSQHFGFNWIPSKCTGYTSINVLGFLKGLPLDNLALSYLHALRPSRVRVTHGETTTDACCWRVTVYLDKEDRIDHIEQEVEVGFYSGYTIDNELRRRGRRTS